MRTLAIIGASYLQLPVVERARQMGLRTICFAWDKGAVCKNVCDRFYPVSITEQDEILRICREEQIDGICTNADKHAVVKIDAVAVNGVGSVDGSGVTCSMQGSTCRQG